MPLAPPRPARPHVLVAAFAVLCTLAVVLVPAGGAAAAVPQPRTPPFPPQIEPYPRYEREAECDPVAKPGALDVVAILRATYGTAEATNIPRGCSGTGSSGHHSGRAVDWMTNVRVPAQRVKAEAFIAWLLASDEHGNRHAMARRLGISYLIWDSRKLYLFDVDAGWTEYNDCLRVRTSPADDNYCHRNHVHVSMLWAGAREQTSWWTGGARLPLAPAVDDLGAVSTRPDGGLVTSPDTDAGVLVRRWDAAAGLGRRDDLGGATLSAPSIVQWPDGRSEVVVVGTNGTLYLSGRPAADGAWTGWQKIPGAALRGRPSAVAWPDGTLHVFASGTDGTLQQIWRDPAGTWGTWRSLGGAIPAGAGVSAATAADSGLRVVVRGTDQQAWVKSWNPVGGWTSRWSSIGGAIVADPSVTADATTGTFVVAARGTNDVAYATDLGVPAPRWTNLGGVLVGSPAVTTVAGEGVAILLTGSNGLTYRKQRSEGRWTGWIAIR